MFRVASTLVAKRRLVTSTGRIVGLNPCWTDDRIINDGWSNIVSQKNKNGHVGVRRFGRRAKGNLNDPSEELLELEESNSLKANDGSVSAWDMEFYSDKQLAGGTDDGFDGDDDDDDDDQEGRFNDEYRKRQEEIQRELDARKGRPWTDPWEIKDEQWMSTTSHDDLPDWTPELVSRVSQERVKILPDGIPTLSALSKIPLPLAAGPHPGLGQTKAYAAYRRQQHYKYISKQVRLFAKDRVEAIVKMKDWDAKQDAVDELFEITVKDLKSQEGILGMHPDFTKWVERGLEEFLRSVNKTAVAADDVVDGLGFVHDAVEDDEDPHPVFMDCYSAEEGEEVVVPAILNPLQPHRHNGPGRMVEEWELAAHKKTKRILLRECTRSIARILEENASSRIYVHGRAGTGKTAVLASIVASARKSGYIVLYLPDGDRLRKNGFFVTPNAQREGMFDLQNLSQDACAQLLSSHAADMEGMEADGRTMERYLKDTQLKRIADYEGGNILLVDLLRHAQERKNHAPMCYSVVVETLMQQEDKPFLMVMDEFNCYYDRGHYFHMSYDEDVREPIPCDRINLFEHAMVAMGLSADSDPDDEINPVPPALKRGAIIVGTSESHAVPRKVTAGLTACATRQSQTQMETIDGDFSSQLHVVEVPRFSDVEADHILANFEAIGLGKLRLDRGDTIMNAQEVAYLKMSSGCIGQELLDLSVV